MPDKKNLLRRLRSTFTSQIIILGFALIVVIGALLLMLPISSVSRTATPFYDSLFTSVSATCVTGLTVLDTATHWSVFGQAVILVLIQIGGMGVVTMTTVLSKIVGKRLGLQARTTMQEAVSAPNLGEIMKYTRFIFIGCVLFEKERNRLKLQPDLHQFFGLCGRLLHLR